MKATIKTDNLFSIVLGNKTFENMKKSDTWNGLTEYKHCVNGTIIVTQTPNEIFRGFFPVEFQEDQIVGDIIMASGLILDQILEIKKEEEEEEKKCRLGRVKSHR